MMNNTDSNRLSKLIDSMRWQVLGLVETDRFRQVKFTLRDLAQYREVARRREWARDLSRAATTAGLERRHGFRLNPFKTIDLEPVCVLGEMLADKRSTSPHRKSFHVNRLLPSDGSAMQTMLDVALHEDLLRVVIDYLGVVPVIGDIDFFTSLPIGPDTQFSSSQLYHCDSEASSQVKFFVYCGDVDVEAGPFEFVDAEHSQLVRDRIHYRYGGRAYRVDDATMDKLVPHDQHTVLGPRGTSLLLDTGRCFHRGSRIRTPQRRRMVAVVQFVPPSSTTLPLLLRSGAPYAHLIKPTMSPIARAVLGEAQA